VGYAQADAFATAGDESCFHGLMDFLINDFAQINSWDGGVFGEEAELVSVCL
jgi:hypothetical protein